MHLFELYTFINGLGIHMDMWIGGGGDWDGENSLSLSLACKCKTSAANRCLSKELASKSACHFWDAKGCHRFNMVHGGFIYHTQTLNVRHVYLHAWLICMVNVGISILLLGNCRWRYHPLSTSGFSFSSFYSLDQLIWHFRKEATDGRLRDTW